MSETYEAVKAGVENALCHAVPVIQEQFIYTLGLYCRPSAVYWPKLSRDGNAWCALYGEDLQSGVCGFGNSPAEAMAEFDKAWDARIESSKDSAK